MPTSVSSTPIAARIAQTPLSGGPTDPDATFVDLGGGRRVAVASEGKGPVLFLVHGLPGSRRDFRYLAPELAARGVRAVRIDLPGFGQTPFNAFPALKSADRALLLPKLADAMGIERFGVLGHSFGCAMCYVTASICRDRVSLLAAVNGIGVVRHKKFPRHFPRFALRALSWQMARHEGGPLHQYARRIYDDFRFPSDFSATDYASHLDMIAAIDFAQHRAALRKVRAPVLIVSAEDDPIIDARSPALTARAVQPGVRTTHIHLRVGGHYLQKHAAALIAEEVAARIAVD